MIENMIVNVKNGKNYEIAIKDNFSYLANEIKKLDLEYSKICIISDSEVAPIYLEQLLDELKKLNKLVISYVFKSGEENKNLNTVHSVYNFLIQEHVGRKDLLVALGGGVVGDLTGFVAATYLRGIDFIQVPTTVLSMVDSSVGGKTGVDFNSYKNMVGAFKMPILVYMNLQTLTTLEDRQFYSGFAEAMKSALIKDVRYYEWLIENMYEICERDLTVLEELVKGSIQIKKSIVEKDPYENGERALLNLGHTIGHAIEKYKNFTLYHGECVSLGCVAAAYISWQKELLSSDEYYEIRDMFVPFYLPISIDDVDEDQILEIIKSDKKIENGYMKFILLKRIGKAVINTTVTEDDIKKAIKEIVFTDEFES